MAFDTSAAHCAAALLLGDRIITRTEKMAKGQAEYLMPMLQRMLADEGAAWSDLNAIGVGIGPGNFTGIRISVSAARGLALGLGRKAIGVSALEAFAFGTDGDVTACIDARRDRIYAQSFSDGVPMGDPIISDIDTLEGALVSKTAPRRLVGSAAETVSSHLGWQLVTQRYNFIEAVARIARLRMSGDVKRPSPLYLRSADAAPPRDQAPVILP